MAWREYLQMSSRQRRKLALQANRGDSGAQKALLSYTRAIKTEVNARLLKLEKAHLDYGKAYNNVLFFTQTEYGKNRFQSPTALDMDWVAMTLQNDIGYKFLNTMSSTTTGARQAEQHRLEALRKLGKLPEKMKRHQEKEFLRFLGQEEISAALDEYGTSEVLVEAFYKKYKEDGSNGLTKISHAVTEFLANRISFDEAMERVGIKLEDYYSGKPTS